MSESASHLIARMQCRNSRNQEEIFKEMERLVYLFFEPMRIKYFKRILYSLVNESLSFMNPGEYLQNGLPKVLVVDSRYAFKEHEFYGFYPEHKNARSKIAIYRPTCEGSLIAHTQSVVKQNLVKNIGLKLIIILGPSSRLYRYVAQKFDRILHRTPIMCKMLFIWDSTEKSQIIAVNRREISQAYTVEIEMNNGVSEAQYHLTFTGTKNRNEPKIHKFNFNFQRNDLS